MSVLAAYQFDWSVVWENLGYLLGGLKLTVALAASTMAAGLVLGVLVAVARMSSFAPVAVCAYVYVEVFRLVPLLLALFWVYYALPQIIPGLRLSPFLAAFLVFALNLSALNGETFRAGLLGIDPGQRAAALSLGMRRHQVFVRILLPQAVRRVIPVLASTWVGLFKDTAIVFVIAIAELTYRGQALAIRTYRPLEIFTALMIIYFLVTWPQARIADRLYDRFRTHE